MFAFVTSGCATCHKIFSYHPNLVPSVRVNGVREPVCQTCVERANVLRVQKGLEPFAILPGAYEAADENTIDWSDHG